MILVYVLTKNISKNDNAGNKPEPVDEQESFNVSESVDIPESVDVPESVDEIFVNITGLMINVIKYYISDFVRSL